MTDITEMNAKQMLAYYQEILDEEARQAKREGRLVCWSASVAPPEFCVAMDIAMVYPETHAAGIGARKGAMDMLEVARTKGIFFRHVFLCKGKPGISGAPA